VVTGNIIDSSGVNHGFARTPNGKVITFDVPGAGTGAGQGTFGTSNTPSGSVAGSYVDGNNVQHGFL
jgi:hypothetical protein